MLWILTFVCVSGENLKVNRLLHQVCIFQKLTHLLVAMNLGVDFGNVLTEDVGALVPENGPQVLHEGLAKEHESLLAAVFEVNVEVVLSDALCVGPKLVEDFFHEFALAGHLRGLNEDVERHLHTLFLQKVSGDVEHLAKGVSELGDAFGVIDFIPQLVHHANLDELAELADEWLPEGVHLYCLGTWQAAPIFVAFELL